VSLAAATPVSPPLVVVERTAPRRYVATAVGTPCWSAGASPQYAVGDLILKLGWRLGVAVLETRTHEAGYCVVPLPTVEARRETDRRT